MRGAPRWKSPGPCPPSPLPFVFQLATLEFEKTELGQQDEFEREARLYAEGQLADAARELAAARQALAGKEQLLADVRNELQLVSSARAVAEARWKQERGEVEGKVQQVSGRAGGLEGAGCCADSTCA